METAGFGRLPDHAEGLADAAADRPPLRGREKDAVGAHRGRGAFRAPPEGRPVFPPAALLVPAVRIGGVARARDGVRAALTARPVEATEGRQAHQDVPVQPARPPPQLQHLRDGGRRRPRHAEAAAEPCQHRRHVRLRDQGPLDRPHARGCGEGGGATNVVSRVNLAKAYFAFFLLRLGRHAFREQWQPSDHRVLALLGSRKVSQPFGHPYPVVLGRPRGWQPFDHLFL